MSSIRKKTAVFTSPAPGSRRPRFTREQLGKTALAIADAEGFEAVSMRRVAEALDAGTMTLYHYVQTKDELFALMHNAVADEVVVPGELPKQWRAAVTVIAHASRQAFIRHTWLLHAMSGIRFGPNFMRHVEQSFEAVANAPCDEVGQQMILSIVDNFVFGNVLSTLDDFQIDDEFVQSQVASGAYPHFQRAMQNGQLQHMIQMTKEQRAAHELAEFDLGLESLLDGIEKRLKAGQFKTTQQPTKPRRATRKS